MNNNAGRLNRKQGQPTVPTQCISLAGCKIMLLVRLPFNAIVSSLRLIHLIRLTPRSALSAEASDADCCSKLLVNCVIYLDRVTSICRAHTPVGISCLLSRHVVSDFYFLSFISFLHSFIAASSELHARPVFRLRALHCLSVWMLLD